MKKSTVAVLLFLFTWAGSVGRAQDQQAGSKPVKLTGCVQPGKEMGCLVLKSGGKQYSLHFTPDNKPKPGTAVSLQGTAMDADQCMQGNPVKVSSWTASKVQHCPKAEPGSTSY